MQTGFKTGKPKALSRLPSSRKLLLPHLDSSAHPPSSAGDAMCLSDPSFPSCPPDAQLLLCFSQKSVLSSVMIFLELSGDKWAPGGQHVPLIAVSLASGWVPGTSTYVASVVEIT